MTLYDFFTKIKEVSLGGWFSIFLIFSYLIEVSKIKIYPIQALGKLLNKSVIDRMDKTEAHVDAIELKLDEHVAQSLRTKIIRFMDDIINFNMTKTQRQWKEIIRACAEYEKYIEDNGLINGDGTEAIEFLHAEYQRCCESRNFKDLPIVIEDKK